MILRCERGYHVFYFLITHVVDLHELCQLTDNIYGKKTLLLEQSIIHFDFSDYPSCCLGKVKVDSIDDVEEMQIMDEAFDILGFKWVQLQA